MLQVLYTSYLDFVEGQDPHNRNPERDFAIYLLMGNDRAGSTCIHTCIHTCAHTCTH